MSAFLKTVAKFAVGAVSIAAAVASAAPATAAASTVPVRVVPGMPKTVDACNPGGFTVTTAPMRGTAVANDAGFVYTANAGVTSGQDTLVGHCKSDAATTITFRIVIAGRNPNPVKVTFAESCKAASGTVTFTMANGDTRRHSVQISSAGLSPRQGGGFVPASSSQSVAFGIGAAPVKVAVSVNGGSPSFLQLQGCPAGNGAKGVVPGKGSRTGGGFLATRPGSGQPAWSTPRIAAERLTKSAR